MDKCLLDTGPLVALLDRSEKNHERCTTFLRDFCGVFLTTEAVITEAMYLLNTSLNAQRACSEFLVRAEVEIIPSTRSSIRYAVNLMEKYRNLPMDFADATLVLIADETGFGDIFTLDHRGFGTYRHKRNKPFNIYPT